MVGSLFAQYLPDVSQMSETEKMLVFENNKKSPALGVFFSLLLPSTGHAYAKNWKRGLAITGLQLVNFIVLDFSNHNSFEKGTCPEGYKRGRSIWDSCENLLDHHDKTALNRDEKSMTIYSATLVLIPVLIIWESVDAAKQVKKYNNNVYRKIFDREPPSFSLNLQPTYQGANLTMSYAFN